MLPVFILIIVTLLSIAVFHFTSFRNDCLVQREIVDEIKADESLVRIVKGSNSDSSSSKGFLVENMYREYSTYGYVIDEAAMIRAGEFFGGL